MQIREALEQFTVSKLRELAERAETPTGGSRAELLSRLSRSFGQRGGFPELVSGSRGSWDGLLGEECRTVLGAFEWSDDDAVWEPKNLGELKKDEARQLLIDLHRAEESDGDFRQVCGSPTWSRFFKETPLSEDAEVDDHDAEFEDEESEAWLEDNLISLPPGAPLPEGIEHYTKSYRHQDDAAVALKAWWNGTQPTGLVVLPTGAGKSFVGARFSIETVVANQGSVLWLAHRAELANQAVRTLLRASRPELSLSVGRFEAGPRKLTAPADVVVASIPTLAYGKRGLPNLTKLLNVMKPRLFDLIVIDECHHLPAKSWRRLAKGLHERMPRARFLGLTATPFRSQESEEQQLRRFFFDVYQESPRRLIEERVLARPRVEVVSTGVSYRLEGQELVDYRKFNELPPSALKKLSSHRGRNKFVIETILGRTHLRPPDGWGPSLVFAISVEHARKLADTLKDAGTKAVAVTGDMPPAKRAAVLKQFQNREIEVITTVMVLTEGSDLPNLRSVFLARPINSRVLFAQAVGRAMRGPAVGGTETCEIVGFSDELSAQFDEYLGDPWSSFLPAEEIAEEFGELPEPAKAEEPAPATSSPPAAPALPIATPKEAEPPRPAPAPTSLSNQQKRVLLIACVALTAGLILYRLFLA